jgi:ABC-type phosphate transport system auxiliary subunit
VQPAFTVGELLEHCLSTGLERKRAELLRRQAELLAQPPVLVKQRRVFENQLLPRDALERRRLLVKLATRASRLRGLQHFLPALRFEPVERKNQLRERVDERQADEQEAEQDELEERARVIHAKPRSVRAGWL